MSHDITHAKADAGTLDHGHDEHHHHGTGTYWAVFIALMVLLVATVAVAFFNLGPLNVPVAYAIASLKAVLILWFFMHLNESTRLVQVFAFASFAWLLIFLIMIGGEYLSRGLIKRAEPLTTIRKVDSYEAQSGYTRNKFPITPAHAAPSTQPATTQPAGSK